MATKTQQTKASPSRAMLWMSGALISFCLMAVGARELSEGLSIFQALFFRSVIGLIFISSVLVLSGKTQLMRSSKIKLHSFRHIVHFIAQYGWFLGIGLLPLAEVFALEFTVPLWTAVIASVFLGEIFTGRKLAAIALGIAGVVVIVQPGHNIIDPAALVVLGAAVCFAIAYVCTKTLTQTDHPSTIIFYMCLMQLPIGLAFSLSDWRWPDADQWLWIGILGITALSAHFCSAKAMLHIEVSTIITLDFLRLPMIAVIGLLFYQEPLAPAVWLGGALMVLANIVNLRKPVHPPN